MCLWCESLDSRVTLSWRWGRSPSRRHSVLNPEVIISLQVPDDVIEAVTDDERNEIKRREQAYRNDLPPPEVRQKTVILVDDGIATGSTMTAAVAALRQLEAARIVVATPTVAATTLQQICEVS